MPRSTMCVAVGLVALALASCASPQSEGAADSSKETLTVYAAASLESTFTALADAFEEGHPDVDVVFNFGGSSDLVAQIHQGAPADVFASADEKNMAKLRADDLVSGKPRPFASNTLAIAVPPDNPARVTALADLSSPRVDVVVCAPEVPCGAAAAKVAASAGLTFHTVSEEQSVTDVLNKVSTGQAEAGLVYITDVREAGKRVKGIDFAESGAAVNVYPIATVAGSPHRRAAKDFIDLVLGPVGQKVLHDAGFARP